MADRYIEYMPVDAIPRASRNPKRHAAPVIRASMERHGFVEAITIDERTGRLVAGHGRIEDLEAARATGKTAPEGIQVDTEGRWYAPVQRGWSSVNDDEAEAYLLTSNQATIAGGWDTPQLAPMVMDLQSGPGLAGVGFTDDEIHELLAWKPDAPPPRNRGRHPGCSGDAGIEDRRRLATRSASADLWRCTRAGDVDGVARRRKDQCRGHVAAVRRSPQVRRNDRVPSDSPRRVRRMVQAGIGGGR